MSRVWDIPVHDSTRVRDVRVAAEEAGSHAALGAHRTAITALAATELATNLLKHAGGGHVVINIVEHTPAADGTRGPSVHLFSLDHGPGIADVVAAMRDGYSTAATSLGAGLGTCLRISSAFDLHSAPGKGAVAMARIDQEPGPWQERPEPGPRAGGINVPLAHAEHSGDAWTFVRSGPRLTLMLADGLGHGPKAAEASTSAVGELRRTAQLPPADMLRRLDSALRPTRGAAVAVAQLDEDAGELHFAGVGNIGARLRTGDAWEPLLSHPGIVGGHFPAGVPVRRVPWTPDSLLVLHSDGLPSRWSPPDDPQLLAHDPAVVAAVILRDASSPARPVRDDTSVAVLAPDRRTRTHDHST
ncbi:MULTISPECIES: ATP-binding SpoIIE family protein phosphatase [Streptomyces]|uniref:ATP-binding SpoIIE family protein phosphatase n=1 Tax=Streptomyces TaxID=1883 RepID=UPI002931B610|nr:ATP-binding SpoIIE family protein phosphatase [Streptomyces sp. NEAU-HV9]